MLGADPGTILAAVTPVPETLSEYQFAGLLRGQRVELVDCVSQPLKVPAEAEIVIEGEVSLTDYRDEGPYGDHTGYYNSVEQFPVFTVDRDHHAARIRSICRPIPGGRRTSRRMLGEALNEVFVPLLRQQFPEIVDFWLPPEGCSYRIAVVSMKKAYPGHAKRVMMAVWSYLRQFMYTKWVIVVDDDINARDWKDVMWAISTRMDPARDITRDREHADRLSRFCLAGKRAGLQDRAGRHQQAAARNPSRMGPQDRHGRGRHPHRHGKMAALGPSRQRKADLEIMPQPVQDKFATMFTLSSARAEWGHLHARFLSIGGVY